MGATMILVPAEDADSYFFWMLRCDPDFCHWSRRPAPTWEEHQRWWKVTSDDRFVALVSGHPIGILRINADGEVSLVVLKTERGHGYGREILVAAADVARAKGYHRLWGSIMTGNLPSQRAFQRAGWHPTRFERWL